MKRLCEVLQIARSSFYAWLDGQPRRAQRATADAELAERTVSCRPDYAEVEPGSVAGQRVRAGEVGIIRGLPATVDRARRAVAAGRCRSDAGGPGVLARVFRDGEFGR